MRGRTLSALLVALLLAPSVAYASDFGALVVLMILFFQVVVTVLALLVAAVLRAGGAFDKPKVVSRFRWIMVIAAIIPLICVYEAGDAIAVMMAAGVDVIALAIIFWMTRPPKSRS